MKRLVILDNQAVNSGNLPWGELSGLVDLTVYQRSSRDDIAANIGDAEMVLTNGCRINAEVIDACPNLEYVGVMATGFNHIDVAHAAEKKITVTNVAQYSTNAVAQLAFALLLEVSHQVGRHSDEVHAGRWTNSPELALRGYPLMELEGKTLGIWGYGAIGKRMAQLGLAFGMKVLATSRSRQSGSDEGVDLLPLAELLAAPDVISLHLPLSPETRGLVNQAALEQMKDGVILINSSRGPIIQDADLIAALESGKVAWYATDVLPKEPPPADLPLLRAPNCIITPHIAWAALETRQRLRELAVDNVRRYLAGTPSNVVS